jgi:hypothetical protein
VCDSFSIHFDPSILRCSGGFRQMVGSLLIQNGASLAHVKDQMDYISIKITADTYAHLIASENASLIDRLDAISWTWTGVTDEK